MKTLNLRKLTRAHWLLLGVLLAGTAVLFTTRTGRQWVRHRVEALSAALLFKPQTGPAGQGATVIHLPPTTFTVRSFTGKCLEYTPPTGHVGIISTIFGTTVFVNDCNGGATQQVRVEELTDRPGHLVVLHLGNQVLGTKTAPAVDIAITPGAGGATGPTPLEPQDYTGSPGQIFALDGDSIILAADRTLAVQVQNGRGASHTPLVLGRRELADSEFWTFSATDRLGWKPTSGFVRVPQEKDPVKQAQDFVNAVQRADQGTVIEVDPGASINLTNQPHLSIQAGVTIRGDRRGTLIGPEISTSNPTDGTMLEIDSSDVRITGLRLRGPSRSNDGDTPGARGILIRDNLINRPVIIDHNDLSDWPTEAIGVDGGDSSTTCGPHGPQNNPPDRPENVRVVRNFIHHNEKQNDGYGVDIYNGGYVFIEGNTFVSNRHAIAAGGQLKTRYRAWYNLVLSDAPAQYYVGLPLHHTHDFDMHGTGDNGLGGSAGEYIEIAWNTFLGTNRHNFELRGDPYYLADFHHNVSLEQPGDAINCYNCGDCGTGVNKLNVQNNLFTNLNPTARLGVGDFDGDGKDDLFLATGAAWYFAPAGNAEWRFLSAQTDKIDNLLFGDFDGDGRTDVFTQHGRDWLVSWGGISAWEKINESDAQMKDFAVGDFDGDHRADVFYADGQTWWVSYGGVGPFKLFDTSSFRISDLRFGDFNKDSKTDVFGSVGGQWMVTYGGTVGWSPLRAKLTDSVAGLIVADFNGDGRADIAQTNCSFFGGCEWQVSYSGTGNWTTLRTDSPPLASAAATGRFDGNASADVLLWNGNSLDLVPGGSGTAVLQSRQDMR